MRLMAAADPVYGAHFYRLAVVDARPIVPLPIGLRDGSFTAGDTELSSSLSRCFEEAPANQSLSHCAADTAIRQSDTQCLGKSARARAYKMRA